jgi:hypothetical protein
MRVPAGSWQARKQRALMCVQSGGWLGNAAPGWSNERQPGCASGDAAGGSSTAPGVVYGRAWHAPVSVFVSLCVKSVCEVVGLSVQYSTECAVCHHSRSSERVKLVGVQCNHCCRTAVALAMLQALGGSDRLEYLLRWYVGVIWFVYLLCKGTCAT